MANLLRNNAPISGSKPPLSLYILSLAIWALDFKAEAAGTGLPLQASLLGVYTISFIAIMLPSRVGLAPLRPLILVSALFVSLSSIVGAIKGQDIWQILPNIVPTALFTTAAISTYIVLSSTDNRKAILNAIKTVCLFFIVCHTVVVAIQSGLNLSTSRYQFLSGAVVPALAVFVMGAFVRFSTKDILITVANLLIVLISVTRTMLAIGAAQAMLCFIAVPTLLLRPSVFKKILVLALLVIGIISVDLVADTGLTERWVERLTVTHTMGADPTKLTRIAENNFMWDKFSESMQTILIGNGLAAQTSLTGKEAALAGSLVGFGSVSFHSIGFGHNNYLSLLFVGGLLIGAPFMIVLISNGIGSMKLMKSLLKTKNYDEPLVYIGMWGALIILGTLCEGLLSGTLGDRTGCLWYGVGTGMFYWARKEIKSHNQQTRDKILLKMEGNHE